MIKKKDIALSLLSGVLLVSAFPPFDLYLLAWIALVPLLVALWGKSIKESFLLGTLTGFVYFSGTTYWVFNSMYFYGSIPAFFSVLIVTVLSLYLGLYAGIFSALFNFLCRRSRLPALFTASVTWVTLEFIRTYALTGFPWSALGYSQYKFLPVIQIADITGIYGVSFLVAAFNGAVFDICSYWPKKLRRMPLHDRWPMAVGLGAFALCLTASVLYGIWQMKSPEHGRTLRAGVIQGNFEQEKKWDARFKREILDTYKRLSIKASADSPDIIIWPESALPFIYKRDKSFTGEIIDFQKTLNSYLLFGSMIAEDPGKSTYDDLSNSVILMSPGGDVLSTYDKIHLVPFGEYVPLRKVFPFISKLTVGIGDFLPGKEYTVMDTPLAKISSPVCFEIRFPGLVRKFANNGADLIVTVTNDAWFGRSSAPYQHFSMAVFRAVENRVPVLRAANTGISGFIDAKGRIIKKSDIFVEAVLTGDVKIGVFKKSFYSKYGDLFAFLCIISSVLLIADNVYSRRY